MLSKSLTDKFLTYFANNDHKIVPGAPLVLHGDNILFNNSGMVQFKDYFTGAMQAPFKSATTEQVCLRVGGKHNDLENVGYTDRHNTIFTMLGNFSFMDYGKEQAIMYALDIIKNIFCLDMSRIECTSHPDDTSAAQLISKIFGKNSFADKDNLWKMGEYGPCGHCFEVYYRFDNAINATNKNPIDNPAYIEIWNVVFMEFNKKQDGTYEKFSKICIDTGMGLERITSVMQGVTNNYATDIFIPLIDIVKTYNSNDISCRVISDHMKCALFLLNEFVVPSNTMHGYVLRKLIRRAYMFLHSENYIRGSLADIAVHFAKIIHVSDNLQKVEFAKIISAEEEIFAKTLDKGKAFLGDIIQTHLSNKDTVIKGKDLFDAYDTYGLPIECAHDIAKSYNLEIDMEGFDKQLDIQKSNSKSTSKQLLQGLTLDANKIPITKFIYNQMFAEARVVCVVDDDYNFIEKADGHCWLILDSTIFYPESGGQIYDTGTIEDKSTNTTINVVNVQRVGEFIVHECNIAKGMIAKDANVVCVVDKERRLAISKNHTATHLLHHAIRSYFGDLSIQKGSSIYPDRFRFDFVCHKEISMQDAYQIEKMINDVIAKNIPIITTTTSIDKAKKQGAMALFGEKYSENVRCVGIEDGEYRSLELCGGTHVSRTSEILLLKIISAKSVASGVRRIEATTGESAVRDALTLSYELESIRGKLKSKDLVINAINNVIQDNVALTKNLKSLTLGYMSSCSVLCGGCYVCRLSGVSNECRSIVMKHASKIFKDLPYVVCIAMDAKWSFVIVKSKSQGQGHEMNKEYFMKKYECNNIKGSDKFFMGEISTSVVDDFTEDFKSHHDN